MYRSEGYYFVDDRQKLVDRLSRNRDPVSKYRYTDVSCCRPEVAEDGETHRAYLLLILEIAMGVGGEASEIYDKIETSHRSV